MDTRVALDFIKKADEKNGVNIVNGIDVKHMLSCIERIERIEEERKALANDIKEIFEEAKSANFDIKAMKKILKQRRMDEADRQEEEFILNTYKRALEMN